VDGVEVARIHAELFAVRLRLVSCALEDDD